MGSSGKFGCGWRIGGVVLGTALGLAPLKANAADDTASMSLEDMLSLPVELSTRRAQPLQSSPANTIVVTRDQIVDRHAIARQHRAEIVTGGGPADMLAFQHRDAHAAPRGFPRRGEAREAAADHADIDIEIERQCRARLRRRQIAPKGVDRRLGHRNCHWIYLAADAMLVTMARRVCRAIALPAIPLPVRRMACQ